jgi:hypothetical protein
MLTAQQYRARATEYAGFAKTARSPSECREFRALERTYNSLAANKEWQASNNGAAPAALDVDRAPMQEEQILACLGAAVMMRWNTLPKKIQRELFEYAGSIGDLQKATAGQVARFLHNHADDAPTPLAPLS